MRLVKFVFYEIWENKDVRLKVALQDKFYIKKRRKFECKAIK